MLAVAWPFGAPVRFADSGGDANLLRSDNAPPSFRTRLHCSATPKAKKAAEDGRDVVKSAVTENG